MELYNTSTTVCDDDVRNGPFHSSDPSNDASHSILATKSTPQQRLKSNESGDGGGGFSPFIAFCFTVS